MRLYYTGKEANQESTPRDSIGGVISCTFVRNEIFSDIVAPKNGIYKDYRGLILKNTTDQIINSPIIFTIDSNNETVVHKISIVEVSTDKRIERLPNSTTSPLGLKFYNVDSSYNKATITVTNGSLGNEQLEIDGQTIVFSNKTYSTEEVRDKIYQTLEDSARYIIEKIDNDKLQFITQFPEEVTDPLTYTTTGTITLLITDFTGGRDNSQVIIDSLNPGEYVGIWIERTLSYKGSTCDILYKDFINKIQPTLIYPLNLVIYF